MEARRYLEKLYGGLVGKCAGVRLGAPVEPTIWTYERIRRTYGEITGYVKDYTNFAADDDINGPLFFVRALLDGENGRGHTGTDAAPITSRAVARAWLNYAREGLGFFWWGGYGRSTEHTAYLNLKAGIDAPASGSIRVNGRTIAEQIGGQIFIDSWGWVFPDDPRRAADAAEAAARVGHDGNAVYGARFIAACVSRAFSVTPEDAATAIPRIVEEALTLIPSDSTYHQVVTAVRDFHAEHPDSWRDAREFLAADYGYDRYPGVCHIIPNAGVCALALYYGDGDFARTIEIATMCGWDTDCNAGNVGAIVGVLHGAEGIPAHYLRPINDVHVTSSISGALNIKSLPTAAKELAVLGLRQAGVPQPAEITEGTFTDDIILDLSLPGSTGGLRTSSEYLAPLAPGEDLFLKGAAVDGSSNDGSSNDGPSNDGSSDAGSSTERGVVVLLDRLVRGDTARVFYKPYYRREDFDDERYKPTFTPTATAGQTMTIHGVIQHMSGQRIAVAPYVRDAATKEVFQDGFFYPTPGEAFTVEWSLPEVPFAVDEAGLMVMNPDAQKFLGKLVITDYRITGRRAFDVQFRDEREEFANLSRCSLVGGAWELDGESLHVITRDRFQLYSGPYYSVDSTVRAELQPEYGDSHLVAIRARGAEYGYYFGLDGRDRAVIIRRDGTDHVTASAPFPWRHGTRYRVELSARTVDGGCCLTGTVDGREVLKWTDPQPHPYGMAGLGKIRGGRTRFFSLSAAEE